MADLNEPKKETVRITLPPPAPRRATVPVEKEAARINLPSRPPRRPPNAIAPVANSSAVPPAPVRPPPPSVAPKPLPPSGGAPTNRPPAPPMARPPAPTRPPNAPPPPAGLKAPLPQLPGGAIPPPPPTTFKPPAPPSALPPAPPKPGLPQMKARPDNGGAQAGPREETTRIGFTPDLPMKATVKLSGVQPARAPTASVIRTAPAVASPPSPRLVESVPTQLCWAMVGTSALALLIQFWIYLS